MVYILEDEASIRELVLYTLNSQNIETIGFEKPSEFWEAMSKKKPELILLDIMLPEEDGLSILKKMKKKNSFSDIPVILLTAKDTEIDKVLGLDAGADDYVAKPFGMMELVARVKVALRRISKKKNDEIKIKGLYICLSKRIVEIDEKEISLTFKEFELLNLLVKNKSIVMTREIILDKIWGYEFYGETRTVDVHVRTLRQKLGEYASFIKTIRGVGYKFSEDVQDGKK